MLVRLCFRCCCAGLTASVRLVACDHWMPHCDIYDELWEVHASECPNVQPGICGFRAEDPHVGLTSDMGTCFVDHVREAVSNVLMATDAERPIGAAHCVVKVLAHDFVAHLAFSSGVLA